MRRACCWCTADRAAVRSRCGWRSVHADGRSSANCSAKRSFCRSSPARSASGSPYLSFDAIVALAPIEVPRLQDATIDARALLFALAVCIATAVLIGLLPAWRHSALNLISGLQQRSQSGTTPQSSARARKVTRCGTTGGCGGSPHCGGTVHAQFRPVASPRSRLRSKERPDVRNQRRPSRSTTRRKSSGRSSTPSSNARGKRRRRTLPGLCSCGRSSTA